MRFLYALSAGFCLLTSTIAFADTPAAPPAVPQTIAIPGTPINGAVTLLYKYVAGQDLKYAMTSTTTGTVNMGATPIPMVQTMTTDYHQITQKVDADGNGYLKLSMDNATMVMTVGGHTVNIPSDQLQKSMNAMSGMTIVMSPKGKLISIKSDPPAAPGAPDVSKIMGQASSLSNMAILPDHDVNIGDTWRGSMNMAMLGMQTYLKMTLNGISILGGTNVAQVGIKTFANLAPKLASVPNAPNLTGTMNGQGVMGFDVDNGYQKSFNETLTMNMNITPSSTADPNKPPVNGTITTTSKVKMNLVSVTVNPAGSASVPDTTPTPAPANQ